MNYTKVTFHLDPIQPAREILYADLDQIGFESIMDIENGVEAYISSQHFMPELLEDMMIKDLPNQSIDIQTESVEQQNWNAIWESNFELIRVNEKCLIRAPFHPSQGLPYEIIIQPQMSFGTGHHETTFLMCQQLFQKEIKDKTVLDMGCGTGVLSILAHQLKAKEVVAIDIEDWAYKNTLDNCKLNNSQEIIVEKGDASKLTNRYFDVIIANINRNVLIEDMATYAASLNEQGILLLSGFYETDIPYIQERAENCGLNFVTQQVKNNWVVVVFNN